jgi:serine/threonine protein kinase
MAKPHRILRRLGRGGMGEVSLVYDPVRQENVALKRVLARDGEALLRFKREFRLVERLLHPGLVRLFELGEDDDGLYFTMEHLDGVNLFQFCTRRTEVESEPPSSRGLEPTQPPLEGALASPVPGPAARTASPSDPGSPAGSAVDRIDARAPTERDPSTPNAGRRLPVAATANLDRLIHALPQILEALAFLHGQGIVHRDLKPENIMVRRDGVVKLLDFGILGETAAAAHEARQPDGGGTLGFMAPEQLAGEPPAPANDLYALGAMLFVLMTARPVFVGGTMALIHDHLYREAPSLAEHCPDAPPALVEACAALLCKDPDERPDLRGLSRMLAPLGMRRPFFPPLPGRPTLVGRKAEQEQLGERLAAAADGSFQLVSITGPTGAGKTSLAAWLADQALRRERTVLRGQGRPSERVAFNAVDGCIDALASTLGNQRHRRHSIELRQSLAIAAAAFPVLALRPFKVAPAAAVTRIAAFSALTSLVADEARRTGGVLLLIDDFQWADEDSVALLQYLAEAAPPATLLVTTMRDDVGENAAARWLASYPGKVDLPLDPLDESAIESIVQESAQQAGAAAGAQDLRRVVASCGGFPFLAELAGRALAHGPSQDAAMVSIASLLEAAAPPSRDILALIVAADDWTGVNTLARWSEHPPGQVLDALAPLERDGLIRIAGMPGAYQTADVYHSSVREAALKVLGAEELRRSHGVIATHLEADPRARPQRLVRHLLGAGREQDAARLAPEAAARAEQQQAYALAAELYEIGLRHPGDSSPERAGGRGKTRLELLRRRAAALELCARYSEAARCWRERGEALSPEKVPPLPARRSFADEERQDALLREAGARLAAADLKSGRHLLDETLRAGGERAVGRGGIRGLWAGVAFITGPPRRRVQPGMPAPDPTTLARAERDVRLGQMVGYFDPLAGIRFLRRARRGFVRSGAAEEAALCDYLFAYFALFAVRRRGEVPLARRYTAAAREHLTGREVTSCVVRAMPRFIDGIAAQRDGRWSDGVAALEEAVSVLEEAGIQGTFEHLMALTHRAQMDLFGQNLSAYDQSVKRLQGAARDAGASAMRCHVVFCEVMQLVFAGRFQEVDRALHDLAEEWPADQPSYQRFIVDSIRGLADIYHTDCHESRRTLARALVRDRAFRPLKSMYGGLYGATCALVEANALRTGDPQASARRCRRFARLAEGAAPLLTAGAWRALAYAADAAGEEQRALALLERAEAEAQRFGQRFDLAISRYQRGRRLAGDEGAKLVGEARRTVVELGAGEAALEEDAGLR